MTTFQLDPSIEPWERQPGETAKKHGQFITYRDLGLVRTLTKVAEKLTLSYGHTRNLAADYLWQQRAAAWDAHNTRQYQAMLEQERRRAAEADATILRAMTGLVGQALPNMRPDTMTWTEFTRLAETTMRLRRQLFGDPTDTIAITGPGGADPLAALVARFAELTPEQRRQELAALSEQVARRIAAAGDLDDE
ncbi:hypothetical protein ABT352_22885 [Streptosporangium sp. NPDC000563]|uniref:hypothetical protein n=1 Tax=Streptosporangium sp. NPDC000563 TaxID=3154366 RepID=UPI003318CC39